MGAGEARVGRLAAGALAAEAFLVASGYTYFLDDECLDLPGLFRLGCGRFLLDSPVILRFLFDLESKAFGYVPLDALVAVRRTNLLHPLQEMSRLKDLVVLGRNNLEFLR